MYGITMAFKMYGIQDVWDWTTLEWTSIGMNYTGIYPMGCF